jgi:hypothetical protein
MPREAKPKPDDPAQSKRFVETAREVGASEHAEDFDKTFDKVVRRTVTSKPPSRS